jgi:hypothetical protein
MEHFDQDHYIKVYQHLKDSGKLSTSRNVSVVTHPLFGKTVLDSSTNKKYIVVDVKQQWYRGWYFLAILKTVDTNSHRTFYVGNINSHCPDVLHGLDIFEKHFTEV